ncbi:beta-mannosidase [Solimonas terrae]|uniref:Beta-mannosidase n=1 Tax=Solimonas terrae TaxID=1396819 RepID=A0A6M2BKG7_9GAMM|nr:glycoside hydrolase family 2 protein [Solimonas terrae]NGY03256.1 glycoside hydrolase family 2 protein [Solimonas terrae]
MHDVPSDHSLTHWEILDCDPGKGQPQALQRGGAGWIAATAPGDTYLALHQAGRLPHPYADGGEAQCAWVRDREWWWRTSFETAAVGAGERLQLCFEGLDTYATIWLDGVEIARSDNMFVPVTIDMKAHARADGVHVLLLRFDPPALRVADREPPSWPIASEATRASKRALHRKAQYGWGWDWGPDLPTVGIWRPVTLRRRTQAALEDLRFSTLAIAPSAMVEIETSIAVFDASQPGELTLRLLAPSGACVASERKPVAADGRGVITTRFGIADPQLWWTPELGEAPLYRVDASLRVGANVVDRKTLDVGLRTIELDTSADPDEPGCDYFRFILNGVPIFCRGMNWIPASAFIGAVEPADYERSLRAAADANMNMVRVWGGGVYEPDAFYRICDRLGLLVWQDFMFACSPYPDDDPHFTASVQHEVEEQVRRLRNHPSLALWCGNNEGQVLHQFVNLRTGGDAPYPGDRLFESLIPAVLQRLDPETPYRPGSPYGKPVHNSMRAGDVHNWTVWHGAPPIPDDKPVGAFGVTPEGVAYMRYSEDRARFVSEFGIQASPDRATLEAWSGEGLTLDSDRFLDRIKDHPKDKVNAMLVTTTGLPTTLDQYIGYTQLVQAEGLKFGIEHYRRRKPHCAGTLIWQHNDSWPGISWSLVDYEGRPKPAWHYVRRAYAPLLASFRQRDDGSVELWLSNDFNRPVTVKARLRLMSLQGQSLWHEDLAGTAAANSSAIVWSAPAARLGTGNDRVLLVRSDDFHGNELLFAPFRELALPARAPAFEVRCLDDGALDITLSASCYQHFVQLRLAAAKASLSDNCFAMHAGEQRRVIARADRPLSADELAVDCFNLREQSQ